MFMFIFLFLFSALSLQANLPERHVENLAEAQDASQQVISSIALLYENPASKAFISILCRGIRRSLPPQEARNMLQDKENDCLKAVKFFLKNQDFYPNVFLTWENFQDNVLLSIVPLQNLYTSKLRALPLADQQAIDASTQTAINTFYENHMLNPITEELRTKARMINS